MQRRDGGGATPRPRRRVAVLLALLVVLGACGQRIADRDDTAAEPRGERWDDGRVAFTYPTGWEVVEQGGPDEYLLRIEPPGSRQVREDLPTGTIVVFWPSVPDPSLEGVRSHWGVDPDDPAVEQLVERPATVPGATDALRQDYRVPDATPTADSVDPARYRTLLAMGEVGRPLFALVGAPESSNVDVDVVGELVLGTLRLHDW